jgi:hypothetical protein
MIAPPVTSQQAARGEGDAQTSSWLSGVRGHRWRHPGCHCFSDIAQATGLAQAITINNTPAQAVPVREQNLDGGNVKVHEQGVATVTQTGTRLRINLDAPNHCHMSSRAGKQLVIEYVSGSVLGQAGSAAFIELGIVGTNGHDTDRLSSCTGTSRFWASSRLGLSSRGSGPTRLWFRG